MKGISHQKKAITKATLDFQKQYALIRNKISELKKQFHKFHQGRMGELYNLCNEIVELKKALPENRGVGKRYTFRSLEWEEGLGLTSMDIRYIQAYIFISDYAKNCVKKGLINDTTICHFLAVHSLLREDEWQDKLVDMIIKKDIKVSQVSELTRDELKLFLQGKLKKRISDDYFFTATKTIRSIRKRIAERGHLLSKSNFSDNLFNAVKGLYFDMEKLRKEIKKK